jgi:Protein of unknown function (DUF2634)
MNIPGVANGYQYGTYAPKPDLVPGLSKSWLFEIVENGIVIESFTLLLPPSAYTIKEPQRVSITKTFGNAFIDDYGPDNIQLTIKGISGTAHVFPTFKTAGSAQDFPGVDLIAKQGKNASLGYTGRQAFYLFRDKIMRYKDADGWDRRELRVYDLADEQAYRCILLDFTVDRTSETPLRYPFVISLFVYQRLDKLTPKLQAISISKDPFAALNKIDAVLGRIVQAYQGVTNITDSAYLLQAKSSDLRTKYAQFLSQTTKVITSPLNTSKSFIDTAFNAINISYDTYRAGKYTHDRYMGALEMFRETLNEGLKIYGYQISEGWRTPRTITVEQDDGISIPSSISDSVSRDTVPVTYEYSAIKVYTVKGDDTLQRIALNELGDEDLWPFIASINDGISGNDDLVAGEDIFLPSQVQTSEKDNKEQFILTEDVAGDPYGSDIKLDDDGNVIIQENGDFSLVSGLSNIEQAVDLRLNTEMGALIKQSAYGITAAAGFAGTTMALRYLKLAIRVALIQDPRIESVTDMIVSIDKDAINIGMTINVIGSNNTLSINKVL